jgi:hypothetical protein
MSATSRSASTSAAQANAEELAETFRVENAATQEIQGQLSAMNRERHEIADFVHTNEAAIQHSAGVGGGLVRTLRELDEANAPMKEIKAKNNEFRQRTAELRERMTGQLGEIA